MDLAALYSTVHARLTGDTGAGGLTNASTPLVSAIYNTELPAEKVFPVLVWSVAACVASNAFAKDVYQVTVRVKYYVEAHPAAGGDALATCSSIVGRVFARLHRWAPSLTGAWTATAMEQTQTFEEHELPQLYSGVQEFRLWVSAAA